MVNTLGGGAGGSEPGEIILLTSIGAFQPIQRYKNKAVLSTADSLSVAPMNSASLTCAQRGDSPPCTACGSSETDRPPSAQQQQGPPLTAAEGDEGAHKSEKKHRQNRNFPNTGGNGPKGGATTTTVKEIYF